jgi:3D (Asp-Asp-Asp) domain-containing protein
VFAFPLAGCGGGAHHAATRPAPASPKAASEPTAPVDVALQLQLPLVGLSPAPTVRYATTAGRPTLRGTVSPATATVYMENPNGNRTALNPRSDGSFSVRAKLDPGANTFKFTAAQLGAHSASAQLAVTWRGAAADAMRRLIAKNPAKYLPPASAGLNHKIPKPGNLQALATSSVTVTFSLNPIVAPPPPPVGGGGKWLGGFELTEYYPALESWFKGALVSTPGLPSKHRIDWLYSARGLSMEGSGIGLDGRTYHIDNLGAGGWLTSDGSSTAQFGNGAFAPFWRTGGFWRSASNAFTIPLGNGGWSNGVGIRYVPPPAGISFAAGTGGRQLAYLRSVAVDPGLIPFGSHIYIPAYAPINGGWFEADDTGGAINGRHIDVYRPPPSNPNAGDSLGFVTGQRVYIVPPSKPIP